jgi:serine/threonine protein kinase
MGAAEALTSAAELRAERPLAAAEALAVMRDVATLLAACHARGQVHGAVCPENIVLDAAGAARLCRDTLAPRQVSPEQQRGQAPDARSDLFALGAAVAELLGSAPPPEPLRRLLATMTAEDPAARPQTADEVLLGLDACELMTGLRPVRPGQPPADPERAGRRLLPLAVVGLGLVVLGLALVALLSRTPPQRGAPPESYKPLIEETAPPAKR